MDNKKLPFKFSDRRQERIYEKLKELGSVPAGFFKDACEMWEENPPKASQTNLMAHCMREVMGTVIDLLLPLDFAPSQDAEKNQTSHKEKVQAILEAYDIPPDSDIGELWLRTANKQDEIAIYHFVHRKNLGFRPNRVNAFSELWESVQTILDTVLNKMESKYIGFFDILDKLLAVKKVTKNEVEILKEKVPNSPVVYNHFFTKLDNPDWLTLLNKAGFFSSPPPPFEHPDGGISYPFWHQSEYLKKMAKLPEKQQEVFEICSSVETDNLRSRNDVLEASLLLPVEMTVRIVEKIDALDYFLGADTYGKLIVYLSANGKTKEAADLARRVLAFIPDPRTPPVVDGQTWHYDPVTIIRDHEYEDILEKNYPGFVDSAGIEALKVLFDQLESFINQKSAGRKKTAVEDDYSEIWRSAIEDHSQNHKYGVRDSLITAMRDASERLITSHPEKMGELLTDLESRKYSIFRRLKLHLLRKFPKGVEKKITSELLDKQEFAERTPLTHEYFLLAEQHGSLLSHTEQKALLEIIGAGGEYEKKDFEALCKKLGIKPTAENAKKHKDVWQTYHLAPFKKIKPFKELYDKLTKTTGEPDNPDLRIKPSGGSWGFSSSISPKELQEKKPDEIVKLLSDFEPDEDRHNPLGKSREGTSRALITEIAEEPAKWSTAIASVKNLDPTFVRSFLQAHREALKKDKSFDWEPLIELGTEILKKPIEIKDRKPSGFYGDDPNWNWCRHTLAELLHEGMASSSNKIPLSFRKNIWSILEVLTHDASPTPAEAEELIKNNDDPLTAAINTTRGDAVQAAIQYGIWLKSSLPEKEQGVWKIEKDAPELKALLEEKLDATKEPFLGVSAIFGSRLGNLGWLDASWVKEIIPLLFPDDPGMKKHFDAAWEAYIIFNPAYDDLLPILEKQYARAVSEIGSHSDNKHHLESPDEMVAVHLLQYYYHGKLSLDSQLFKDFYSKAPIEYKGALISFIGRNFKGVVPEKVQNRVKTLAEWRLSEVKKSSSPQDDVQEFKEFSWWVSSEVFDEKWAVDLLLEVLQLGCDLEGDHLVVERFLTLASKYPLEVITSLELMVQNDKKGWGVPTWGDELRQVIQLVLDSGNKDAVTKAEEFVHRLVAKGHPQYKDIIK